MRARLCAVLVLVVVTSAFPVAGPVRAGSSTEVTHDCTHTKVRPHRILFACGDGNFYVTYLRWGRWLTRYARARGVFHFNDCDPNCAEGTFHKRRGKLHLRDRLWCPEQHLFVFRRARVVYRRPRDGQREFRFRLYCPF
jgi:hypothetical protein